MTKLCHVAVIILCLFLTVLWDGLQYVIVAVPGRTHFLNYCNIFYTVLDSGAARTTDDIHCHLHKFLEDS